jgi:hypothetical protein
LKTKRGASGKDWILVFSSRSSSYARLAGGFLQPIDPDALKAAITKALSADLGDLDRIKELPGFPRAAAATLSKAWAAGLNLAELAATAGQVAAPRLGAVARLDEEVLRHLPSSMRKPADLVGAALPRTSHARTLFGRIAVHGRTGCVHEGESDVDRTAGTGD